MKTQLDSLQGKVAVVCLAGDMWVHSDEDFPVGMLDIGLPSHKTLFQLQAERLRRIQAMAQRMQEGTHKTRSVYSTKDRAHNAMSILLNHACETQECRFTSG